MFTVLITYLRNMHKQHYELGGLADKMDPWPVKSDSILLMWMGERSNQTWGNTRLIGKVIKDWAIFHCAQYLKIRSYV